jgi:N-acetyl-gamma-glutamylphosphate reductase
VVRGWVLVLASRVNRMKGAAGIAVQNLNLMLGCAEEMGLY